MTKVAGKRFAVLVLCAIGFAVGSSRAADSLATTRPNIVLIMADDMGYSDVGCYGGEIHTPTIDRLAAEGLRFSQFYNNAKCTTTRASLLTGLYPRNGGRGIALLDRRMLTLGEALRRAGYRTSLSGKWHLGSQAPHRPIDRGFDHFYGLMDGCCNFFDPSLPDPAYKGGRVRVFGQNDRLITEFPDDFYTTDAFTDHAVEQIHRGAEGDAPFFVHVTYTAPHYPLHAPEKDVQRYLGKYLDGWEALRRQRYARQQELGLFAKPWELSDTDSRSYAWEQADQEFEDRRMAVYAAMVDVMDRNIGRIVAALEESGAAENTLVLFLSDNGGCAEEPGGRDPNVRRAGPKDDYVAVGPAWGWAQNTPFRRYKTWMHEGGIATPLVAWWPGRIAPGSVTHQVGHIIDFMPTFLELAGGEYPTSIDGEEILPVEGRSLRPVLLGEERPAHDQLCWHWAGNRAIRQGSWKLVWDKLVGRWELYDLSVDRTELHDVASSQPERVEAMSTDWHEWAAMTEVEP